MPVKEGVWSVIEYYIDNGISVIPVYDKPTKVGKITYPPKKPCEDWTEYQSVIINKEFLFQRMDFFNTDAIALICGKVSGNLEIIDIDVKWAPGIGVEIFKDIAELLPSLYKRLRIHKSPSSGYHILFRILGVQPSGNKKISGRERTPAEKQAWVTEFGDKKAPPYVWFVETRGEGGYVVAPPSIGYTIVRDFDIPVITLEERESLINICRNYNQIFTEPKVYKPSQEEVEYYDENPFWHFSRTANAVEVLEGLEWKFVNKRGKFLWFTRPGKDLGVSGSFNVETRCFWVFTSNSILEESKGYFLSSIVSLYKFDNDKRKTYKYLVDAGFGKIKSNIELKIVKRKAATYNTDLPKNLSKEAKEGYEEFKKHLETLHPYGIFWMLNDNDTITINREKLYYISAELGFRVYEDEVWRIEDRVLLSRKNKREYYDIIKAYVQIEDDELQERVLNSYEKFIKDNGEFTMKRLKILTDEEILYDTRTHCYKFYKDNWITITKDTVEINKYDDLKKLIFATKVQQRSYKPNPTGKYLKFLDYAVQLDLKPNYIKKIVGYFAHDFKDSTMGYIVILTEQCNDPKQGGGTGKNIFCQLLNYTTTYVSKPGEQANLNEKFLQSWQGQRVFGLSDLPRDFNFSFLKEFVTGSSILKRLFKDEKILQVDKLPKIICSTQWSFKITDGGLKRRIVPLEFTDFFTKMNGVDTYFGCTFPDGSSNEGFTDEDWAGYDWFITQSIQEWMRGGLKLYADPLSTSGWNKQFRLTYTDVIVNIIEAYWDKWTQQGHVLNTEFKQDLDTYYTENSVHHTPGMQKVNDAIAEYAKYNDVYYERDFVKMESGIIKRYKVFKKLNQKTDDLEEAPF